MSAQEPRPTLASKVRCLRGATIGAAERDQHVEQRAIASASCPHSLQNRPDLRVLPPKRQDGIGRQWSPVALGKSHGDRRFTVRNGVMGRHRPSRERRRGNCRVRIRRTSPSRRTRGPRPRVPSVIARPLLTWAASGASPPPARREAALGLDQAALRPSAWNQAALRRLASIRPPCGPWPESGRG